MTDSRVALGMDRLPWLADEPRPVKRGGKELLGWAMAGMLLVAGASYWLGTQSAVTREPGERTVAHPVTPPSATIPLPEARSGGRAGEMASAPAPEMRPAPEPEVSVPAPRSQQAMRRQSIQQVKRKLSPMELDKTVLTKTIAEQKTAQAPTPAKPVIAAQPERLTAWPASESKGAKGRIVRIGAFGSRQQAKLGWRYMVRAYPGVAHLQATVIETRNSRGRHFYRFQIGTTSQAHSEVLCQRMQKIRFSCAVIGLPWKPNGVER
jgi:hypothetical protein